MNLQRWELMVKDLNVDDYLGTARLGVLSKAGEYLEGEGVGNASNEARFMLLYCLGTDMTGLLRHGDHAMSGDELHGYFELIQKRASGIPLAYILGRECFMGLWFEVNEGVLIPRADTEALVRVTVREIAGMPDVSVLELCCGSGAVGISVAHLLPQARVLGVDIAKGCVELSRRNARAHGLDGRCEFIVSDLYEKVGDRSFDVIIANPPYIPNGELDSLQREIRDHEPHLALDGGADGLSFYRQIIPGAREYLKEDGVLSVEIGDGQSASVVSMMGLAGYRSIGVTCDDGGLARVVSGKVSAKSSRFIL